MSERELVEAFVNGGISRRVFIRGLIAAGVSMGAALAYAETIAPNAFGDPHEGSYDGSEGSHEYSHGDNYEGVYPDY